MDVGVGLSRKLSAKELMLLNCGVGEDSFFFFSIYFYYLEANYFNLVILITLVL